MSTEPATPKVSKDGLARLHDSMAFYVTAGALPGLITPVACGDDVHVDTIGRILSASCRA